MTFPRKWPRLLPSGWYNGSVALLISLQAFSGVGAQEATGNQPVPRDEEPARTVPAPATTPKPKDPLQQLWEIPSLVEAEPTPTAGPTISPPAPITGQSEEPRITAASSATHRETDPILRTGLNNAQTNAEAVTEGIQGFSMQDSAFLPAKVVQPGSGLILGPATLLPSLNIGTVYQHTTGARANQADNGFHPTAGASLNLSVGEAELRRNLSLAYAGQYRYESGDSSQRPFTQQLALRGNFAFAKLDLGLGISYAGLSGASRDFGGDVERDLLTLAFTATTELTPKSTLDWDITIPVRRYSGGINSSGVTSTTFLNFAYSPKSQLGVGFSAGTLEVQGGDAQQFFQVLGRANLISSEIFSFFGTFGIEFRQTGGTDQVNPVFGLGTAWNPRLGTSISLTADNRVQNSGSQANSNYATTSVAISLGQRLGSRFNLSLTIGYENARYSSTGADSAAASRRDQAYFGAIGLQTQLSPRWQGSMTYSYRDTRSNESPFTDSSAQAQLSFAY